MERLSAMPAPLPFIRCRIRWWILVRVLPVCARSVTGALVAHHDISGSACRIPDNRPLRGSDPAHTVHPPARSRLVAPIPVRPGNICQLGYVWIAGDACGGGARPAGAAIEADSDLRPRCSRSRYFRADVGAVLVLRDRR